jgi:predicted ATPase/DNA-binding XRE family transcriptional regulator
MTVSLSFAEWLQMHRQALGLTQKELSLRSGVSVRSISDIERGLNKAPHFETIRLLTKALQLDEEEASQFIHMARIQRKDADPDPVIHNEYALPEPVSHIIGREHEEATIVYLLQHKVRILTITGPAGVGKTRLSLQIAQTLKKYFRDGACFCDLSTAYTNERAASLLLQSLEVKEHNNVSSFELLRQYLGHKHVLLIVDNAEQVISIGSELVNLIERCPEISLLVTSRAPLRVRGEQEYPLAPLTIPDPYYLPDNEQLLQFSAIVLFIQRTQSIRPDFQITPQNAVTISEICIRLAGLPLAIELTSAWMRTLLPDEILAYLKRSGSFWQVLTGGTHDLPARQQTMEQAIQWSYDLLSEQEQRLFAILAVFTSGWTIKAVEAIYPQFSGQQVLSGLHILLEQSLIQHDTNSTETSRFRFLEPIRAFAENRLHEQPLLLAPLRHATERASTIAPILHSAITSNDSWRME